MKEKGSRPDNVFRYVDNIASSKRQSDEPMVYNIHGVKEMSSQLKKCSEKLEEVNMECTELRWRFEISRNQLKTAKLTLCGITDEKLSLKKKCEFTKQKFDKLKHENAFLETECVRLELENLDLLDESSSNTESGDDDYRITDGDECSEVAESSLKSIIGHQTPEIRKLYYSLLADQVPVSKIASIIRSVLKCFNPSLNVDQLRLPQKTCAGYMRREELKTICDAHKATMLCSDSTKTRGVYLNIDGTTKHQKKLGGVVANDMVLSVNELPDGTAMSAVEDISREFEKLRKVAETLGLPNPNSINWTLVVSSSSDSASTQKRVNKLIEERRQSDEKKFGPATVETIGLIETFCSMHLGVNLRKAFLSGVMEPDDEAEELCERKYHRVDTLVHEFCKLFGRTGVPEYASGVVSFPDFLELETCTSNNDNRTYYQACAKVHLHRQVGSRYFVTAANACKIVFLKDAAIEFLKFTGRESGNSDVFTKLQDSMELAHLKADSLMYYHVP